MNNETPRTLPQNVNIPSGEHMPRNMRLTPRGVADSPMAIKYPRILGGTCEFCGTLDPYQPGQYQYKLCPHYRGMEMRCVYCKPEKDHDEVVRSGRLHVFSHPYRPGELVTVCDSFECTKKHRDAFGVRS